MSVHYGYVCDGCEEEDIDGIRFKCTVCTDYDLCIKCVGQRKETKEHLSNHQMLTITVPVEHDQSSKDIADTKDLIKHDLQNLQTGITNMPIFSEDVQHRDKDIEKANQEIKKLFQQFRDSVISQTDVLEERIAVTVKSMNSEERETFLGGVTEGLRLFKCLIDKLMQNIHQVINSICRWIKEKVKNVVQRIKAVFEGLRTELFE